MLKIRDNVSLKELEKFGFKEDYYDEPCYTKKIELGTTYREEIIIWKTDRQIQVIKGIYILKTLYDLIQANLVEKVED